MPESSITMAKEEAKKEISIFENTITKKYEFSLQYGGLAKLSILYLRNMYAGLANFEMHTCCYVALN